MYMLCGSGYASGICIWVPAGDWGICIWYLYLYLVSGISGIGILVYILIGVDNIGIDRRRDARRCNFIRLATLRNCWC